MPVAGEPLIRRIVAWLSSQGVTEIVLNLHHRPETIAAVVGHGRDLGARVRYSWEQPLILGSAGGPRLAIPVLAPDAGTCLIVNGDTLTDVDVAGLVAHHAASGARVTMAVVPNRECDRYGGVQLDEDGRVTGFVTRGTEARGSWHFIGVQVADTSVFERVAPGVPVSTIGGVYDELVWRAPGAVQGFRCDARFWDVGTAEDYWRTSQDFMRREGRPSVGRGGRIHETACVTGSILWDNVEIGAGASVVDCIITDGVRVPAGAVYQRTIVAGCPETADLIVTPFTFRA
jgi:mannose-1-phosphate guanylyltransferase